MAASRDESGESGVSDDRSALRRLDDAVVPALQRAARATTSFLASPLRGLRRWEERFANGRPERFLWRNRQALALVVALIAFAGSYVHLQRYPDLAAGADGPRPGPVPGPTVGPTGGDLPGGSIVVGPAEGAVLADYVQERRDALAEAPEGERLAVVSFEEYVTPERAAELIPDGFEPVSIQLRLPDGQMEPFTVEVEDGIASAAEDAIAGERQRIADEEAEFEELLGSGTVEDEDFLEEFRQQLERLKAVRNLLDSGAGTVFAVVVEGPVEDLRELADEDAVRLVDLAPEEADAASSTFYGLLPDDDERATYGTFA